MMTWRMRVLAVACVLAVTIAMVPAGAVLAQDDPGFAVSVQLPDELAVGETEVQVDVENVGDDVLFSPIVEVPLGTALSAPDPDPVVRYDGDEHDRTFAVLDASFRDGSALYVYGEEVLPGETRTYAFDLVVERAGSVIVEADVRPLYNEPNNVREAVTTEALGAGTVSVIVEDEHGAAVADATVVIDGAEAAAGALSVVEGDHDVHAVADGRTLPAVSLAVNDGETRHVQFVAPSVVTDPTVLSTTGNGSVDGASVIGVTTQAGNAEVVTTFELGFAVDAEGGTTVVGAGPPPAVPDAFDSVDATVDGVSVPVETDADGAYLVAVDGEGRSDVAVTFTGYRTGDADASGAVDAADAQAVAIAIADDGTVNPYGDADGDGAVTAVDAMLIAQYDAGHRDADFGRAD